MIKKIAGIVAGCLILWSCGDSSTKTTPVTAMEVAQAFIDATLQNDLDKAGDYLLKDSTNAQLMERYRESNKKLTKEQLEIYSKSSSHIKDVADVVKDSVVIVSYSPSYKPETINKLKMVRVDGKWQVDIKYTFLEKQE
jgi:hypothetical protein